MAVGVRVLRGPDWDQNEADGGEGHLGTVVGVKVGEGTAEVQWDKGHLHRCRIGKEGKHDLRILDNAPAGVAHPRFRCDGCNKHPIFGTRWRCTVCQSFDLCTLCYIRGKHDLSHEFDRFTKDGSPGVRVGRRSGASKVRLVGIFPGARVARGPDWLAANADGGAGGQGTVVEVLSPESGSARNAVRVSWDSGQSLQHRLGLHGKVDLLLVKESRMKPFVYLEHLPVLNEDYVRGTREDREIRVGDSVTVEMEEDEFKELQRRSSGWTTGLKKCMGSVGVVKAMTSRGDVEVAFAGQKWRLHPDALTKSTPGAAVEQMREGDTVRLLSDQERVIRLQNHHGGWNEAMKSCLGKVGRVKRVLDNGDMKVEFGMFTWHLNPQSCQPAPGCQPSSPDLQGSDLMELLQGQVRSQLGAMLTGSALPSVLRDKVKMKVKSEDVPPSMVKLVKAILIGDVSKVRALLDREPELIHKAVNNETPLHYAAESGEAEVAAFLLDRGADVNKMDKEEDTPLMLAARKVHMGVARVLLERGATVSLTNENGRSALHGAAYKGHVAMCQLLLEHGASLTQKDVKGNTPAFLALEDEDHAEALEVLLASPEVNMYQTNRKSFNLLHFAAFRDRPRCTEVILKRDKTLVNCPTEGEQWGAIHIASVNDHPQVLRLLLQAGAGVNARNEEGITPLHLASKKNHIDIVMMLVEHGAEIDPQDNKKCTPLHRALNVGDPEGQHRTEEGRLQVANFLLQYGASLEIRNIRGDTPLELASPSLRERVRAFLRDNLTSPAAVVSSPPPMKEVAPKVKVREDDKADTNADSAPEIPESLAAEDKCLTCRKAEACIVFLPCAHKVTCLDCAHAHSACPECHVALLGKIDTNGNSISPSSASKKPEAERGRQKNSNVGEGQTDKTCSVG